MLPKATSLEKYFKWKSCQILLDSYLLSTISELHFFLSKRVIWFSFERKKVYFPFFSEETLFYKIDVQRKSQHQEETFLGQPPNWKIKREIQNQNHFHYDYMITLANTLNIWFMYLYYIMSISLLRDFVSLLRYTILSSEQMIAQLVIMTPCFITFYLNMILYKRRNSSKYRPGKLNLHNLHTMTN